VEDLDVGVRDDTRRGSASLLVALPEFGVLGFEFDFDFDFRFVGFFVCSLSFAWVFFFWRECDRTE
jgi:hypothetical protein